MPFHKVIGIDLGTTYSAVSIWDGKDTVIIESALGTKTVPSVVGLDPDGQVIVGAPAQNNLVNDPQNTVIEVKREMGRYAKDPKRQGEAGAPKRIHFRNRDYLPQEISAFILMELKRQAENFVGEPIHDAVITVPAYFKEPQRGATEDAARMARLNPRRLLNEPTAAAVCFGADKIDDGRTHTYAVYDLGGGTFDVSIIQISKGNVSVVGTGGDPRLGGGDFDDKITEHVFDQIKKQHGDDLSGDHAVRQRVKREAEMRKRDLAGAATTTLHLPFLTPTLSVNIPLSRATFEHLISGLLGQSLRCLDEAIESAYISNGVERDEIEQVLLVGGSTRIPRIRPMLAEHLGLDLRDVRADFSPDEVVARGAGMIARDYTAADGYEGKDIPIAPASDVEVEKPSGTGIILQDVTSHTLGILANAEDFIPILPKDSRIPGKETRRNFINGVQAKELAVLIFQGEHPVAFENTLIGRLPILLPEARERGHYRFEVKFDLDKSGLLTVEVTCLNDNSKWDTEVQCSVRSSRVELEQSRRALEEARAESGTPDPPEPPVSPGLPDPPPASSDPVVLPDPPAEIPAEFRSVARRSYKLIAHLEGAESARLSAAYRAFVAAVQQGSDDVEDLGDQLTDLFYDLK